MLLVSPGKNQDNRTTSYSSKSPFRKHKAYIYIYIYIYATEEDTDDEGEEIVGLVTEHALSANRRSNWFVDSGVTCHMCNNKELFDQIIHLEMPQEITVGDGHSVQATGQGDNTLGMNVPNGKIRKCKLSDILYVSDLSHNLLSVSSQSIKQWKKLRIWTATLQHHR